MTIAIRNIMAKNFQDTLKYSFKGLPNIFNLSSLFFLDKAEDDVRYVLL